MPGDWHDFINNEHHPFMRRWSREAERTWLFYATVSRHDFCETARAERVS